MKVNEEPERQATLNINQYKKNDKFFRVTKDKYEVRLTISGHLILSLP